MMYAGYCISKGVRGWTFCYLAANGGLEVSLRPLLDLCRLPGNDTRVLDHVAYNALVLDHFAYKALNNMDTMHMEH